MRSSRSGDTIYGETTVLGKWLTSARDRGIVEVETRGYKQDGTVVCVFRRKVMVPNETYVKQRGGDQPGRPEPAADPEPLRQLRSATMGRLAQTEGLTEFEHDILATVRDFTAKEIIPVATELEHRDEYPAQIVAGMKKLGLFGLTIEEKYEDSGALYREAPRLRVGEDYVINGQKMWLTNGGTSNLVAVLCKTDDGHDAPHRNMTTFLIEKEPGFGDNPMVPGLTVPGKIDKMGYKGVDTTELILQDVRSPRRARSSAGAPARASTR